MNSPGANLMKCIRRGLRFGVGLAVGLMPAAGRGDTWTNAAGQSIEAELVSVAEGVAVFQRPDGTRFDLPVASLSPAAQQQVAHTTGNPPMPEAVRPAFDLYVRAVKRLDELHRAKRIDDDEKNRQSAVIREHFEKTCRELNVPAADRDRWLRLAQSR